MHGASELLQLCQSFHTKARTAIWLSRSSIDRGKAGSFGFTSRSASPGLATMESLKENHTVYTMRMGQQ